MVGVMCRRWKLVGGVGLAALFVLGCRTVWVHPEATAEKYEHDLFLCRNGVPPGEAPPEPAGMRRDWKQCMVKLGWTTDTGFRSNTPWSTPRPPPRAGRRHKPRPPI